MNTNHLISIIIPCYNQARYLEEAVESVTQQTYQNIEIIIINDGSPDDTEQIAQNLQNKYPTIIKVLKQENNGLPIARNNGIKKATGEYILPLDADDFLDKEMLSKCMEVMIKEDADIVYTDVQYFGVQNYLSKRVPFSSNNLLYQSQCSATSLFKRKVYQVMGGYKQNMNEGYEDWEFSINAYTHGFKCHHVPEPLLMYRTKEESRDILAVQQDIYLKSKITMNHPELYPEDKVQEAILNIQETEDLPDYYFYYDKNIPMDEENCLVAISKFMQNHTLHSQQIINILKHKVGLWSLDMLEENVSIQSLCQKFDIDFILFYAPIRYQIPMLCISRFAWKQEKGIVNIYGTLFSFVFKTKRSDPVLQLLAYQRLVRYQVKINKIQYHTIENQRGTVQRQLEQILRHQRQIKDHQKQIRTHQQHIRDLKDILHKQKTSMSQNEILHNDSKESKVQENKQV